MSHIFKFFWKYDVMYKYEKFIIPKKKERSNKMSDHFKSITIKIWGLEFV